MTKITNQDQHRRVLQALTETCRLIEKESRYSDHLQKVEYLAWLNQHANKLGTMIREYEAGR